MSAMRRITRMSPTQAPARVAGRSQPIGANELYSKPWGDDGRWID